jgi:hypothetical protein
MFKSGCFFVIVHSASVVLILVVVVMCNNMSGRSRGVKMDGLDEFGLDC